MPYPACPSRPDSSELTVVTTVLLTELLSLLIASAEYAAGLRINFANSPEPRPASMSAAKGWLVVLLLLLLLLT
jgi:hypothetical protein